ncbi:hemin uptake protein HemP [Paucibacter aquatile]|uniref:Hemin uptake protein HemP n=1 Tax=Kinneretia aquatilis TaxID=2070761 RepID=A0A2N8L3A5_9BURK|nr:hemin uptake protein HemP [Paucibacter aquatile]PND40179.1 hemin uptake protein HemP [Paucibacter aquatile]
MSSSSTRPASLLAASLALETEAPGALSATRPTPAASPVSPASSASLAALSSARPGAAPRRLSSETLLADRREVEIEHAGQIYRLRVTSLGKLILTK